MAGGTGGGERACRTWIKDVQAERLRAERDLAAAAPSRRLSRDELETLLSEMDIADAIRTADANAKRDLYAGMGVTLTYHPAERLVRARTEGWAFECVGGGI